MSLLNHLNRDELEDYAQALETQYMLAMRVVLVAMRLSNLLQVEHTDDQINDVVLRLDEHIHDWRTGNLDD